MRATREAIGPGVELMGDAVNAWSDAKYAIRVARMIEEYEIRWLEEPVMPDNVEMLAQIARATDIPIAGCEFEAGRWAYRNFVAQKAFDVLMPDVNTVGGISEWLKIAGMAACFEVPLSPHRREPWCSTGSCVILCAVATVSSRFPRHRAWAPSSTGMPWRSMRCRLSPLTIRARAGSTIARVRPS